MNYVRFSYRKAMVKHFNLIEITYRHSFIGISEWKEDLRKFMLHAGLRNTPTVFLFSDTQVMK